jgi:hypothetical protein
MSGENFPSTINRGEKFDFIQKRTFSWLFPKEQYKNVEKPIRPYEECETVEEKEAYHDWISKEWNVYLAEIQLVRKEMKECLKDDSVLDPSRSCGFLMKHYLELVSETNLNKANEELLKGKRLVDERGYVYKYYEKKEGMEEVLAHHLKKNKNL